MTEPAHEDVWPWEIRATPHHGLGIFATSPLGRGSCILKERPLIHVSSNPGISAHEVLAAVLTMSPTDRAKLDALYNIPSELAQTSPAKMSFLAQLETYNDEEKAILCRVATNAIGVPGGGVVGDHMSRFNHSCLPSGFWSLDDETGNMEVRAIRDIAAGEEITISYCDLLSTTAERQQQLYLNWCFSCKCSRCSQDSDQEAADLSSHIVRLGIDPSDIEEGHPVAALAVQPISIPDLEVIAHTMYRMKLFVPALASFLAQLSFLSLSSQDPKYAIGAAESAYRVVAICYGIQSVEAQGAYQWLESVKEDPRQALEAAKSRWDAVDWERIKPLMRS